MAQQRSGKWIVRFGRRHPVILGLCASAVLTVCTATIFRSLTVVPLAIHFLVAAVFFWLVVRTRGIAELLFITTEEEWNDPDPPD